jgi:hypothetical protein
MLSRSSREKAMISTRSQPLHRRLPQLARAGGLALLLSACGGGDPAEPARDSVLAIPPAASGRNLLLNPSFEEPPGLGSLPTASGNWQGNLASSLPAEMGIAPHDGESMLKFQATAAGSSVHTLTSRQWQVVELGEHAAAIAAGGMRAKASAWFNRVTGGELTDRRFDLRVMAFDGSPAELPARYDASAWLVEATGPLLSRANQWQRVGVELALPAATTYLLVEICASEDMFDDGAGAEFDGHYADDLSLVLLPPS